MAFDFVVGIDPGFKGAAAVLDASGSLLGVAMMPEQRKKVVKNRKKRHESSIDTKAFVEAVHRIARDGEGIVVMEEPICVRYQGIRALATTFYWCGRLAEAMTSLGIVATVGAKVWQKDVLGGPTSDKSVAYQFAIAQHGKAVSSIKASQAQTSGIADAVCIAHWGLMNADKIIKGESQ